MLKSDGRSGAVAAVGGRRGSQSSLLCVELSLELTEEEGIVFVAGSSQKFEADDEETCADTAGGHHAVVGHVPRFGEEAGVLDTPIPQHLEKVSCDVMLRRSELRTSVTQVLLGAMPAIPDIPCMMGGVVLGMYR
jgi:hypothetical protein